YDHEDRVFRDELDRHLAALRRSGLIHNWYDGEIVAGDLWEEIIEDHLNRAQIIIRLVSAAFLNSDYCYSIEMAQALERHKVGTVRVIPVLLRPVDWEGTPISKLQMLPHGARPITLWSDRDAAFEDIAKGIRLAVNDIITQHTKEAALLDAIAKESQLQHANAQDFASTPKNVERSSKKLGSKYPTLAYAYRGIAHNITAKTKANIALDEIVQQQNKIKG